MNLDDDNLADLFDEFYILADDTREIIIPQTNHIMQPPSAGNEEAGIKAVVEPEITPVVVQPPVITEKHNPIPNKPVSLPPLSFAGANKQYIAFIYNDKIFDSKDNVEMIMNFITKALKFSLDDVAVLRLSKNSEYTLMQILDELKCKKAVLWGCSDLLAAEHQQLATHQIETVNQTWVINAEAAQKYHNNQPLKLALWEAAQKMFKQ